MEISIMNFFMDPDLYVSIDYRINKAFCEEADALFKMNEDIRNITPKWVHSVNVIYSKKIRLYSFTGLDTDKRNQYYSYLYQIPYSEFKELNNLQGYINHLINAGGLLLKKYNVPNNIIENIVTELESRFKLRIAGEGISSLEDEQ